MKKTLKFLLLGLLMVSCASKNKVLEFPLVGASNTTMLVFEKVELTDTATVLTVRGFNDPEHWIKVSPSIHLVTQNKEYELIGSKGVEPGKELFMPEDGETIMTSLSYIGNLIQLLCNRVVRLFNGVLDSLDMKFK